MANINLQTIGDNGLTPVFTAAAAAGDRLALTAFSAGFAHFKNTSPADITVTIVTPGTVRGYPIGDATLVVPKRREVMIALERELFVGTDGRAEVTYSATTKTATVTNKALAANVATLTTSAAHHLAIDETVTVSGVDATFDGTYVVTDVPTSTSFRYAKTAADVVSVASAGSVSAPALLVASLTRS